MYLTVVPVVRLVLVLAVAPVSAGADTYNCIHWGYFQQMSLHVLPVALNEILARVGQVHEIALPGNCLNSFVLWEFQVDVEVENHNRCTPFQALLPYSLHTI